MKICEVCGHENAEDAAFCENCGAKLPDAMVQEEKAPKETEETIKEIICPNCGAKNDPKAVFCTNCGHKLTEPATAAETKKTLPVRNEATTASAQVKEPMSKKNKIIVGSIAALAVLGVGLYAYGKHYYSYEQQTQRFYETVKEQSPSQLAEVVVSKDPNYKITSKNLKKFTDYYKNANHKKDFSELLADLQQGTQNLEDLKIEKSGKYFGLYDKYQLVMEPVYLKVAATQNNMGLKLDGQGKGVASSNDYETTWGPLTPGEYKVAGNLQNETVETNVNLMRYHNDSFEEDTHVMLDMHKVSFTVTSNVDGADVYANDQKVGMITDGRCEVKDLIWHQGMTIRLKKQLADSEITSDSVKITETDYLASDYDPDSYASRIDLTFDNVKTQEDLQYFLDDLYQNVTSFTNDSYDFTTMDKQDLAEFFAGGQGNADEQDFEKFINDVRSSDTKSFVDSTPKVESLVMTGKDTYTAQYLIEYRTVYQDYDRDDVTQVFRYKKATLIYDENDAQFKIQSLGGTENFEVVDNGGI